MSLGFEPSDDNNKIKGKLSDYHDKTTKIITKFPINKKKYNSS